ncbi:MAG: amino acid deaminase/aldolase [Pseudomonadales bacterium]|nr:amino acid deaminase/aldolase [Pseudomonadales bacterium]
MAQNKAKQTYTNYRRALANEAMPLAWVDMDLLDQNIFDIKQRAKGTPIRIASKSVRCEYILNYIFESDAQFQGLMCYHPAEAAYLASKGFDDLLIAYPSMNRSGINSALQQVANGKTIYFMIDCFEQAAIVNQLAKDLQVTAKLCVDLDMSVKFPGLYFGVYRSPIRGAKDALKLHQQISKLEHIRLCALMGYEAQIAGLGDQLPGKPIENPIVKRLKAKALPIIAQRREETVLALKAAGVTFDLINGGGTGSIETTIEEDVITEVAVGSGFYSPHLFDYYSQFQHQPAVGFALEVVRKPTKHRYTCAGGGYVASGSSDPIRLPIPHLPQKLSLENNEGVGEVQTPIRYKGKDLDVGSPVFFRHCKAGEICERFNDLHLIRGDKIIKSAKTYRGYGQCFE